MNNHWDLDTLTRCTRRREFEDGLQDLLNGALILILCLLAAFSSSAIGIKWYIYTMATRPSLTTLGFIALPVFLALTILAARRWIEHFRRVTLWKDRGYVTPLRRQVNIGINFLAVAVWFTMTIAALYGTLRGWLNPGTDVRTLIGSMGIATGIVYFGIGYTLRYRRYKWVGLAGATLSTPILVLPLSLSMNWLLLGAVWASVLIPSGCYALRLTQSAKKAPVNE
jgi:hypothetical protein